jgi:hypothetical protein
VRRLDTVYRNIRSFEFAIDLPNVGSNSTVSGLVTTTASFPLGSHIISWGVLTSAVSLQDLIVTFLIVNTDTLRFVLNNPTGGAIDPASITFQFVTGLFNSDLDETE